MDLKEKSQLQEQIIESLGGKTSTNTIVILFSVDIKVLLYAHYDDDDFHVAYAHSI